jgi:hypothetical protein
LPGCGDKGVDRWLGVPAYPSITALDGRGNALIHPSSHVKSISLLQSTWKSLESGISSLECYAAKYRKVKANAHLSLGLLGINKIKAKFTQPLSQ